MSVIMSIDQSLELKEIPPDLDKIKSMSDEELDKFKDSRGFNILMVAAEAGFLDAVNFLIDRCTNADYEVDGHTAGSLAFANHHHGVVLALLQANSLYPSNFDIEEASEELKSFVELSENLHSQIREGNEENLVGKITENPSLRHFYDNKNNSALRIAMITAMFSIAEILLKFNILLGPHEEMESIQDELNEDQLQRLRELHLKLSPHIFSDVMMTLLRNCRFGPDCKRHPDFMNFACNAFNFLLEIPQVAVILEIVAATREFILVFDFKREWVDYIDPTSEPFTNGLFNISGKIYIAAKNMLDPERMREIMSVITHELCHYAMFLTYDNSAKPYKLNDTRKLKIFKRISRECKANMENEELVRSVYNFYPKRRQHAELIVRAPQLLVLYHESIKLEEIREKFPKLFDNYENECVEEMKDALPAIKKKFRPKHEKEIKKLKLWNFLLIGMIILSVIAAIFIGFYFYKPTYNFKSLTEVQKNTLKNSKANFHGVEVKFCELFANNSEVYDFLTSEVIHDALDGDEVKLSKSIELSYEKFVHLTWENMTDLLRNKILTSNVTFQGQKVQINEIANESALRHLKPPQILQIFNKIPLNISNQVNANPKFIVDRFFALEDDEKFFDVKNDEKIFDEVQNSNIFLLSSIAGEGKSTTFKNFALKLGKKYPWKWIQYVDLKKHFEAYEKFNKSEEISHFLSKKLLKLSDFEGEIFKNLFRANKTIFLWDGVDEISPTFNEVILEIISSVKNVSKNVQFISTRPQHSARFQKELKISAHTLVPLGKVEQWELMKKLINSKYKDCSMESMECSKLLNKSSDILKSFENSIEGFERMNPLLIRIISEIAGDERIETGSNLNFYSVYEIFIKNKLNITQEKGKVVGEDILKVNARSSVNIMQVHQAFALKLIFEDFFALNSKIFQESDLDIMKSIPKVTSEEISRYGIVQVFSSTDFEFNHRTFAEFLVAQFFIDNMEEFDGSKIDTKLRIALIRRVLYKGEYQVILIFLQDFIKNHEKLSDVLKLVNKQNLLFERAVSIVKDQKIIEFYFAIEFLYFLETQKMIKFLDLYEETWINWAAKYESFFSNSKNLKSVFGEEIFKFSLTYKSYSGTLLHEVADGNNIQKEIDIFKNNLKERGISLLLFEKSFSNDTAFAISARKSSKEDLRMFWEFIETNLNVDERKNLLLIKNREGLTALEMSTGNKDSNSFNFIKELYESLFTDVEIRQIFLDSNGSFIFETIKSASYETFSNVTDFLEKLFDNEKLQLRNILSTSNENNHTIFMILSTRNKKRELLVQLLRKTFENDEEFEIHYNFLRTQLQFLIKPKENVSTSDLKLYIVDFQFLIDFWDKIEANLNRSRFQTFLMGEYKDGLTILHNLFYLPDTSSLTNQFLTKLSSTLNKTQIFYLLHDKSNKRKDNLTSLMVSAKKSNEEVLTSFWSFIEENFDDVEIKKLLTENGTIHSAFEYATFNKEPKSFIAITKIYEKYFTLQEIQEIPFKYLDSKSSFIFDSIRLSSFEMIEEISKYFEKLFINDKLKLRELLGNQYKNGETIFSEFVYNEDVKKKSEIFLRLFRKTFENEEEFKIYYNSLRTQLQFLIKPKENVDTSDLELNIVDFQFLIDFWDKIEANLNRSRFQTFLMGEYYESGLTILHNFFFLSDTSNLTNQFLTKLSSTLNKTQIFYLLHVRSKELENDNLSPFKVSAIKSNEEVLNSFWSFIEEKFDDVEKKKLLTGTYYALEYAIYNEMPKSFIAVTKIYEKYFTLQEIQEYLDYRTLFIFEAIRDSSFETIEELSKYFEKLFIYDKLKLRELLGNRNKNGKTIFSYFVFEEKKLEIFKKLLRKTFDENEEEEFIEFFTNLLILWL